MNRNEFEALAVNTPKALLTPVEVADLFGVDPKTVTRWAVAGKLASVKTPGGHHRFHAGVVYRAVMGEM